MIEPGLCCMFREEPIKFRTTTVKHALKLDEKQRLEKLNELCLHNAESLLDALKYCAANQISCFRINSQILPVKTHPEAGYRMEELPEWENIVALFKQCGEFSRENGVRTSFHPDQFVVLNSPRQDVVERSIEELEYQSEVAEWVNADVVNIHGGGAYGNKEKALADFARNLERVSERVRERLTVENDDKTYTPSDLLPLCQSTGLPLVYDVHHHRCLPDELTIEEATEEALSTWNRKPMFHISSPLEGWDGPQPYRHHDMIDISDFPDCWRKLDVTVEVEAKAKEIAVLQLMEELKVKPKKKKVSRSRK